MRCRNYGMQGTTGSRYSSLELSLLLPGGSTPGGRESDGGTMFLRKTGGKISWESDARGDFLGLGNKQGRGYAGGTDDRGIERAGSHPCHPLPRFFSGQGRDGTTEVKNTAVCREHG